MDLTPEAIAEMMDSTESLSATENRAARYRAGRPILAGLEYLKSATDDPYIPGPYIIPEEYKSLSLPKPKPAPAKPKIEKQAEKPKAVFGQTGRELVI